jgi:hypothetical protein
LMPKFVLIRYLLRNCSESSLSTQGAVVVWSVLSTTV